MIADRYKQHDWYYCVLMDDAKEKVYVTWFSKKSEQWAINNARSKYYRKFWVIPFYQLNEIRKTNFKSF